MDEHRGRQMSPQGPQHISPQPSPNNYHDALTGLDPSMQSTTFANGRFNTSQPNEMSFTRPQGNSQLYMNNYGVPLGNPYASSGMDAGFSNEYMIQQNNLQEYQNYPMEQFNINPAELSKISSPDNPSPRLLSPDNHPPSGPQSPASTNGQFHTPQHSRNTSLDPNSAYGQSDWPQFRQHQRTPSDVSDVSSVHNSPYLPHVEIEGSHSPLFTGQDDNTFGIDQFTIADTSPSASAYVSPRLMPEQESIPSHEGLGLGQDINLTYQLPQEIYQQDFQQMHNRNQSVVSEMGQADQYAPPTIMIEPAPLSRQQSFGPHGEMAADALSPPNNSGRGRIRSQSDVTFTRPIGSRSTSPSRQSRQAETLSVRSPSPGSRASSPGVSDGRISKDRRASTSSINNNNREYILDLADPNRPNGQSGNSTRVQKHPATFQCNLCPKRFTRAYNLRSHLRTHTDERPFVCTVCGKAFARQHDRKRHEGLHSGEKKFVCKGELSHSPGQTWGCGRRFARADALGRHFRSEAGRVCIKPLLDEEAAERRQRAMMEQQAHVQMLQPVNQPMMVPAMDANAGFALPAALLAQYPALQNIDWSALQNQGADDGELSDFGGNSGFEDAGGLSDSGTYGHTGQW